MAQSLGLSALACNTAVNGFICVRQGGTLLGYPAKTSCRKNFWTSPWARIANSRKAGPLGCPGNIRTPRVWAVHAHQNFNPGHASHQAVYKPSEFAQLAAGPAKATTVSVAKPAVTAPLPANSSIILPVGAALLLGAVVFFLRGRGSKGSRDDLVDRGQLPEERDVKFNFAPSVGGSVASVLEVPPLSDEAIRAGRERRAQTKYVQPVIIKQGDPYPEGVDPEAVIEVPADHPFAIPGPELTPEQEELLRQRLAVRTMTRRRPAPGGRLFTEDPAAQDNGVGPRGGEAGAAEPAPRGPKARPVSSELSLEERLNPVYDVKGKASVGGKSADVETEGSTDA